MQYDDSRRWKPAARKAAAAAIKYVNAASQKKQKQERMGYGGSVEGRGLDRTGGEAVPQHNVADRRRIEDGVTPPHREEEGDAEEQRGTVRSGAGQPGLLGWEWE